MSKSTGRKPTVLPETRNNDADFCWGALLAQRDLELELVFQDQFIVEILDSLSGKRDLSSAEIGYLSQVAAANVKRRR